MHLQDATIPKIIFSESCSIKYKWNGRGLSTDFSGFLGKGKERIKSVKFTSWKWVRIPHFKYFTFQKNRHQIN